MHRVVVRGKSKHKVKSNGLRPEDSCPHMGYSPLLQNDRSKGKTRSEGRSKARTKGVGQECPTHTGNTKSNCSRRDGGATH